MVLFFPSSSLALVRRTCKKGASRLAGVQESLLVQSISVHSALSVCFCVCYFPCAHYSKQNKMFHCGCMCVCLMPCHVIMFHSVYMPLKLAGLCVGCATLQSRSQRRPSNCPPCIIADVILISRGKRCFWAAISNLSTLPIP